MPTRIARIISFSLFLSLLLISAPLFASNSIGAGASYQLTATEHEIDPAAMTVVMRGSNFFGEKKAWGMEYAVQYPIYFSTTPVAGKFHADLDAAYKLRLNRMLSLDFKLGAESGVLMKADVSSYQLGLLAGVNFNIEILKNFGIGVIVEYVLPVLHGYDNTIKFGNAGIQRARCGLTASFLY